MLGKDPESPNSGSPTLYYDDETDTYLFQSWKVTDADRLARMDVPDHETVIEFPRRMMQFFLVKAGEDVRWLARKDAAVLALPGTDFRLFDGEVVMFNHFAGDGTMTGEEVVTDPDVIALCTTAFEAVWERATPHRDYRPV
ncbi:DUF6879 family protein [Embleya sp. MST-111070]|uniref:DUF6879 family protein n=1 Tax=Embleya sp. MST-111070 TaxID=3398231 RepID=UPI003F738CD1